MSHLGPQDARGVSGFRGHGGAGFRREGRKIIRARDRWRVIAERAMGWWSGRCPVGGWAGVDGRRVGRCGVVPRRAADSSWVRAATTASVGSAARVGPGASAGVCPEVGGSPGCGRRRRCEVRRVNVGCLAVAPIRAREGSRDGDQAGAGRDNGGTATMRRARPEPRCLRRPSRVSNRAGDARARPSSAGQGLARRDHRGAGRGPARCCSAPTTWSDAPRQDAHDAARWLSGTLAALPGRVLATTWDGGPVVLPWL